MYHTIHYGAYRKKAAKSWFVKSPIATNSYNLRRYFPCEQSFFLRSEKTLFDFSCKWE